VNRRTFYALGAVVAGGALAGCVVAAVYLNLTDVSIAIPVIVAFAGVAWTMLWGAYREPQRDALLLAQFGAMLDAREPNSAQPTSGRVSVGGKFSASPTVYAIPATEEVRDHLRLERFLIEARMPDEASRRNSAMWLGVLRSQQPYLTARHSPEVREMLLQIWNEVKAESMRQLRAEVKAYVERTSPARPEASQPPNSTGTSILPELPDRSDSGLPRIIVRTTRDLTGSEGQALPAGTEGIFV
jgi:hypothetical protein